MDWITDEKVLKPEKASLPLFLADTLKSFLMTFETQVIITMGESQSGKSLLLKDLIEVICYYNIDGHV